MDIIGKALEKSNSYNYYKINYEKLKDKENQYKKIIEDNNVDLLFLKNELINKQHEISILNRQLSEKDNLIKKLKEKLEKHEED